MLPTHTLRNPSARAAPPQPPPVSAICSLVTRAAGARVRVGRPASTIHLERAADLADEVVEVGRRVEEESPRRQRVEGPELVLHLVEEGATTTITTTTTT